MRLEHLLEAVQPVEHRLEHSVVLSGFDELPGFSGEVGLSSTWLRISAARRAVLASAISCFIDICAISMSLMSPDCFSIVSRRLRTSPPLASETSDAGSVLAAEGVRSRSLVALHHPDVGQDNEAREDE